MKVRKSDAAQWEQMKSTNTLNSPNFAESPKVGGWVRHC